MGTRPTGEPLIPPGIDNSTTLPRGSGMIDPAGKRSCARCAPLSIWRSTGTVGGLNEAPLMVNSFVETF